MKYSAAVAAITVLTALALSACDKPAVVTPAPPVIVSVPGPAGPPGPQGATGTKGETGDNIIVVDPNSAPKR